MLRIPTPLPVGLAVSWPLLFPVLHPLKQALFILYGMSLGYAPHLLDNIFGFHLNAVAARKECTLDASPVQRNLLFSLAVLTLSALVQELRQLVFFRWGWFKQPWNLLDAASITIHALIISLHLNCHTSDTWLRGLAAIQASSETKA